MQPLAPCVQVYAAGSEDMDTLTFNSPLLLKHLTFSEQKKMPVHEVDLKKTLEGLELTMDGFIDLCILLGCDYMEPVKGIGPKSAYKLVKEFGNLEAIKAHLEEKEEEKKREAERKGKEKVPRGVTFPDIWPFEEAREIFRKPDVLNGDELDLKWEHPDVEGLVKFLCTDKGFSEDRVRKGAEKLSKSLGQKQQGRLDGFFKPAGGGQPAGAKRKADDDKKKGVKGADAKKKKK